MVVINRHCAGLWIYPVVLFLCACAAKLPTEAELSDGENDPFIMAVKADGQWGQCAQDAVLSFVNDSNTTVSVLHAIRVHKRARVNIITFRDGPDGVAGTQDDGVFESLDALDAIPWVGPVAFTRLMVHAQSLCDEQQVGTAEVIFSPRPYAQSHLARVATSIDEAETSIDIAMYSFSDHALYDRLAAARDRGVLLGIRVHTARDARRSPEGTRSARLEDMGIDVRYVNKIMHHKFAIIDGPRDAVSRGANALLITGSANWSYSAGTRYDENTVFLRGDAHLISTFQNEFNHLWNHSRDFTWNESIEFEEAVSPEIDDEPADSSAWVVFTSDNFRVYESARYGPTFQTIRGTNTAADQLVELILAAQDSIRIASGHLRSKLVADALATRSRMADGIDIRIYLDGQEYLSESYHRTQLRRRADCLVTAGDSETRRQDCVDRGFLYSYALHTAGIPIRYKYYAYRWDYHYAAQMHHKYFIIDDRIVASGSYNLSDNAEHNTFENIVIYQAEQFPELVDGFIENFDQLWTTGRDENLYPVLRDDVENGAGAIPLVFPSMALTWDEVTGLKTAIRSACPAVNSEPFRAEPQDHLTCPREN